MNSSRYKELLEMHQELRGESLAIEKLVAGGGHASGISSSFLRKIEGFKRKGYPITIGLVKEVSKKIPLFSEKSDLSGLRQQYELEKELLRTEIVARRSRKESRPPLLTAIKKTNLISAERGWREAPADILLAIAEGLATGLHWWLMNPNRQPEREVPDPKSLDQVRDTYLECWLNEEGEWDQWATKIWFSQIPFKTGRFPGWLDPEETPQAGLCRMRWTPIRNYRSGYNYERSIQIEVLPGTTNGVIRWNTGTGEPSSFIGCILVILPDAEDDGRIAKSIAEDDELVARYAKIVFEAKKAGYGRIKLVDPQWKGEPPLYREDEYFLHLGYRERRSWTIQGEERRIARWPRRQELLRMIEAVEPLKYEVIK